jgi:hypothetical protein
MGVKSIGKPAHTRCPHVRVGVGCGIYAERPGECRDFVCQWLKWPQLGDDWRPDRAKFVMCLEDSGRRLRLEADPAHADAWRREPYYSQLKALARSGAARGLTLQVWAGDRSYFITPEADIDLGVSRSVREAADELKALTGAPPAGRRSRP